MIKTLIADDNLQYTKNIINNIISKIPSIKVEYVSTNGKETLDIISKMSFDLILLDLKMPELSGLEILDRIDKLNIIKRPKIIIVSGEMPLIKNVISSDNVCNIILKSEDENIVYRKILEVANDINYELNCDNVKEKVILELLNMGYNLKHKGTKYIIESVMYIYQNNNFNMIDNLEKNVYSFVAYKHNKSMENIKTNIIKSTKPILEKDYSLTPKNVITKVLINNCTKVM